MEFIIIILIGILAFVSIYGAFDMLRQINKLKNDESD